MLLLPNTSEKLFAMFEIIAAILIIAGSLFMLIAALGIIKLHDVYMRMHAITKASSLGIVLLLMAVVVVHPSLESIIGAVMVIVFIIATAPVATHMIARVSHMMGIPLSKGAVVNELDDDPILCEARFPEEDSDSKSNL
jgi:multicomponent Na+:H+ antiporter subunit G